jgi:hypothetical protein
LQQQVRRLASSCPDEATGRLDKTHAATFIVAHAPHHEGNELLRLGDANHPACLPAPGITSWLRPIVDLLVDNHATAQDRIFATELEHAVFQFQVRFARAVRFEITEIAGMAFGRIRSAMRLFHRIEMATGRRSVCGRAIAELMDVKSMFARRKPGDVSDHLDRVAHFCESYGAGNLTAGGRVQNGNRFSGFLSEGAPQSERQRDRNQPDDVDWRERFVFHKSKIRLHAVECKLWLQPRPCSRRPVGDAACNPLAAFSPRFAYSPALRIAKRLQGAYFFLAVVRFVGFIVARFFGFCASFFTLIGFGRAWRGS